MADSEDGRDSGGCWISGEVALTNDDISGENQGGDEDQGDERNTKRE
jgi:hypothetical protein